MPDGRLLQIALKEAAGLTPEALGVLAAELEARGIGPAVGHAVEAQTRTLSGRDVDLLVAAIQKQPCPECGRTNRPLHGGEVARATSFVLFTTYACHTAIGCPACLAAQARRAALVTAAFGWWGFPAGPIQSVRAIRRDLRTIRQRERDAPSEALRAFVEANPGLATALAEGASVPAERERDGSRRPVSGAATRLREEPPPAVDR